VLAYVVGLNQALITHLVQLVDQPYLEQRTRTMPQPYTIIDPQPWAQNSRENKPSIWAPLEMSRIPSFHPTNPPQPPTLHIHQSPIIHIDFALEISEPSECEESALWVEGDEVVRVRRKLNDRVAALVEDRCFGGHEAIAYSEFLRGWIPSKVVDRAFLLYKESGRSRRGCLGNSPRTTLAS